ncbi:pyridoxal-dependent decarboxylase [Chryseobacterium sp.]|uniref:pyridoxal phosphate-dependent decarboxylase family protein n=1 Tax=Chryseobacterium sp. TaxID=1871047 RepID=UPI0025BC39B7|nr:pyridoxal-dependent decarboxylase [Chryseobacterium sp.]
MNTYLKKDLLQIENLLEIIKKQGTAYINSLPERSTTAKEFIISDNVILPENGCGAEKALEVFNKRFEPIMVSSSGPRYWGFVTGGATPASTAGDWLTSIYDQNTQNVKGQGGISAVIEFETIKLLLDLLRLPDRFLGGFVTGATMSNFTCLGVARQWLGREKGVDIAKGGVSIPMKIFTATPHSSSLKALSMLGLGSGNIIKIKTEEGNREALSIQDFENKISELKGEPFILISSGGTVNTVDFDDFTEIKKLKEKYNFWWHIDAAFGGFAACSESHKHLLKDWEFADSITVDCHKWLNVPYESAVYLVKEEHKLLQMETFQNSNAPYLGDPLENFSYSNFLPENSRRMRALPAWFSLMAYGKKGYEEIISNSISLSQQFGDFIDQSENFKLLAPVRLNTVCFTLKNIEDQDKVDLFLEKLNKTGKVFMTPTFYNQYKGIRAAFVNWMTNEKDVQMVSELMQETIKELKK